jgi:RNA polymerase-binding transcription factor DksA
MGLLKMEENELEYFKNLLTAWLEELRHSASNTVEGLLNVEAAVKRRSNFGRFSGLRHF